MADIKESLKQMPESNTGKHLLYWLSLAAVSFTVLNALKNWGK